MDTDRVEGSQGTNLFSALALGDNLCLVLLSDTEVQALTQNAAPAACVKGDAVSAQRQCCDYHCPG